VKASAPGKVLLLGEHAVVYGHPALAAALRRRVTVEVEDDPAGPTIELLAPTPSRPDPPDPGTPYVTRRPGTAELRIVSPDLPPDLPDRVPVPPELLHAASEMAAAAGAPPRFRARVRSELPLGGGLGSSAALGVALARAFAQLAGQDCPPERAEELALQLERVFHGAPSGVDPAICARGGVILFRRGDPAEVERLSPRLPLHLAVVLTGVVRGTRSTVLPLSARRAERPDLYDPMLAFLGELARGGARALERGDLQDLGVRFDAAHGVLGALGVSCPELEEAVAALRGAGALGAKLTGAGGGGAAIGLARDAAHAEALVRAAEGAGMRAFAEEIAP
jgi:mevalonate kinase